MLQHWGGGMGRARTSGSQGQHAPGGSGVLQNPVRVQGWGWLGCPHICICTGVERRCWAGLGCLQGSGQRRQGAGRQRGGGWSRQGIDSRTNACNFITNLSTSVGGRLRGCSRAIRLHAGRLPGAGAAPWPGQGRMGHPSEGQGGGQGAPL